MPNRPLIALRTTAFGCATVQAKWLGGTLQQAALVSFSWASRQSFRWTVQIVCPSGRVLMSSPFDCAAIKAFRLLSGLALEQMISSPRCVVRRERSSMLFRPIAMRLAHGCRTDNAFIL